jgi:hypothetical protein
MRLYPPPVTPGQRYFAGEKMRWVLAVGNDQVIYSRGGDSHRECQVKTFVRWLREAKREERT